MVGTSLRLFSCAFFKVSVQRIAALHFAFFARDHPDPAVLHSLALAPSTCIAVEPHFDVQTTVNHKFAVAVN